MVGGCLVGAVCVATLRFVLSSKDWNLQPRNPFAVCCLALPSEAASMSGNPPQTLLRPKTRAECPPRNASGCRACPWVSCRYHLQLDVFHSEGKPRLIRVDGAKYSLKEAGKASLDPEAFAAEHHSNCALDHADRGPHMLKQIAPMLGVSRQMVQTIEAQAIAKLRAELDWWYDADEIQAALEDLLSRRISDGEPSARSARSRTNALHHEQVSSLLPAWDVQDEKLSKEGKRVQAKRKSAELQHLESLPADALSDGQRLRKARLLQNLNQKDLGELMGCSEWQVRRVEYDNHKQKTEHVAALLQWASDVLEGKQPQTRVEERTVEAFRVPEDIHTHKSSIGIQNELAKLEKIPASEWTPGLELRKVRLQAGLSAQTLAERIGVGTTTVRTIETDPSEWGPFRQSVADKMAAFFGVSLGHDTKADEPTVSKPKSTKPPATKSKSKPKSKPKSKSKGKRATFVLPGELQVLTLRKTTKLDRTLAELVKAQAKGTVRSVFDALQDHGSVGVSEAVAQSVREWGGNLCRQLSLDAEADWIVSERDAIQ